MKTKHVLKVSFGISIITILTSCGSSNDTDISSNIDTTTTVSITEQSKKAQKIFESIPSPVETTKLLQSSGAKYNAQYLNPIENVSKYSSVTYKALNLGIYGTDLSFTSVYSKTQESMLYLRCTNTLANSLGISGAFDETTTARIEANLENKDSLLKIISDSYWNSDAYLNANGQQGVSALIVAGGWIEGLYIATQIANTTKNETISASIIEQKSSLNNLVELLDTYKKNNEGITTTFNQLLDLKKSYETENSNPAEQLKEISTKISIIRNKIIR
jgi:hypothetical protein